MVVVIQYFLAVYVESTMSRRGWQQLLLVLLWNAKVSHTEVNCAPLTIGRISSLPTPYVMSTDVQIGRKP